MLLDVALRKQKRPIRDAFLPLYGLRAAIALRRQYIFDKMRVGRARHAVGTNVMPSRMFYKFVEVGR